MTRRGVTVVSTRWDSTGHELGFVVRSIAGAASRSCDVTVLTTDPHGTLRADGAFDVMGMGPLHELRWPDGLGTGAAVLVDELTPELVPLLEAARPPAVFYICRRTADHDPAWRQVALHGEESPSVKIYVPVNSLAAAHRHHGFGFTDYLMVLSGRTGTPEGPPAAVAWLTARFAAHWVVVVEDAVASAWKGRALRGRVPVDTRIDLWRLMAHATVCIDLAPGPHLARECIEALRFGTPIVTPTGCGAASTLAAAAGGATFADPYELFESAMPLVSGTARGEVSARGRRYADAVHGDPALSVDSVRVLLSST